jgi:hypothetical protein
MKIFQYIYFSYKICFYLVEDIEEPNIQHLFETLYSKAVLINKGKDERKKKLQQVTKNEIIYIIYIIILSGFY